MTARGARAFGAVGDRARRRQAGTAYLVAPEAGSGPGVLVLHSWWGLTPFFRNVCDRLADAGFVALAPADPLPQGTPRVRVEQYDADRGTRRRPW
jgi:dienelactone hydrolase